jgi:fatty acid kinase fatty acid binding subunit
MKIVTDSGVDVCLPEGQKDEIDITSVPLTLTLQGKTYSSGQDISNDRFYSLLESTSEFPATSQPSPGAFAEVYRRLAAADPHILSMHISSGLSGTLNAARLASRLVPQAKVTYVDTKTLSIAAGWQVEAAARALKRGLPIEKVLELVKTVADATEILFTLEELRYLIHGGRISHIKGLLANFLKIKPVIGVDKTSGKYIQQAQARSLPKALESIVKLMEQKVGAGSPIRVQIAHARNFEAAKLARRLIDARFKCSWLPDCSISVALGAHTGPSVVGVAFAPAASLGGAL